MGPALPKIPLAPVHLFDNREQAIAKQIELALKQRGGNSYVYTHETDKGFSVSPRFNRPCYGELRPYKHHDPNATDDVDMPTDLFMPFPEGKPTSLTYVVTGSEKDFIEFVLTSDASPWRAATKDISLHRSNDDRITHVTFHTPEVHSDMLVNMFMHIRNARLNHGPALFKEYGWLNALILSTYYGRDWMSGGAIKYSKSGRFNTYLQGGVDLEGMRTGVFKNLDLDPSFYWTSRFSYRRPVIEKALSGSFKLPEITKPDIKNLREVVDFIEAS